MVDEDGCGCNGGVVVVPRYMGMVLAAVVVVLVFTVVIVAVGMILGAGVAVLAAGALVTVVGALIMVLVVLMTLVLAEVVAVTAVWFRAVGIAGVVSWERDCCSRAARKSSTWGSRSSLSASSSTALLPCLGLVACPSTYMINMVHGQCM